MDREIHTSSDKYIDLIYRKIDRYVDSKNSILNFSRTSHAFSFSVNRLDK